MYDFRYKYILPKYGKKQKLLFTDTDSLCYENETEDFFQDISGDVDCKGYFHGASTTARGKEIHLSLMVNTDGVSIFRSSNFGLRPVYFVLNELPQEKRIKVILLISKHN